MSSLTVLDVLSSLDELLGQEVTLDTRFYVDRVKQTSYLYEHDHGKGKNVVAVLQWPGLIPFLDVPKYWQYLRRVPGSIPYGLGPNFASVTGIVSTTADSQCAFDLCDPSELNVFGRRDNLYFRLTKDDFR